MRRKGFTQLRLAEPRSGFTLIELLVVISIISLLATMIMPSLGMAKRYAKRVNCLNNLRVIGIGWRMYLQENSNAFPLCKSFPEVKVGNVLDPASIMLGMQGYVESLEAWHCKADDMEYWESRGTSYEYSIGWGYPLLVAMPEDMRNKAISRGLSQVEEAPDLLPVIWDAEAFHPSSDNPEGRQAVFYDGHAAALPADWADQDAAKKKIEDTFTGTGG